MLVVPDASVILKWVIPGEDASQEQKALGLLESWVNGPVEIILPSLWVFEVGNVLGLKRPAQADDLMNILLEYRFDEANVEAELCSSTLKLVREFGVTFYDAVYHALAITSGGTLVTADARYHSKAGSMGHVELL